MAAMKDILEPSLEVLGIRPYKPKKTEEYMSGKMREHFTKILSYLQLNMCSGFYKYFRFCLNFFNHGRLSWLCHDP